MAAPSVFGDNIQSFSVIAHPRKENNKQMSSEAIRFYFDYQEAQLK